MRGFIVPSLLLATACSDYDLKTTSDVGETAADIVVDPLVINFGDLAEGTTATSRFTISNEGDATLYIDNVLLDGSGAFALTVPEGLDDLPAGASSEVLVDYTSDGMDNTGVAAVLSSDPETPRVEVELYAGTAFALLDIDPESATLTSGSPTKTFTLTNLGDISLSLDEASVSEAPFSIIGDEAWPVVLGAGESTTIDVRLDCDLMTEASISDQLEVVSADGGTVWADLTGSCSGPIAVCYADPAEIEPIHDSFRWIGADSYDTTGLSIVEYQWTWTSQPSGSTLSMTGSGANRGPYTPTFAGTYEATLRVQNSDGVWSEPCLAVLEAVPGEDFWVELYWEHSGDDMDLHLLAPSGSLTSSSDCYYANCTGSGLNWGDPGSTDDDPSLDIDDIPGTGPENINIRTPQNGTYTVVVHDYPGSSYTPAQNVTINIYIGGVLAWTDTKSISGENDYTNYASVTFPGGTITPL